MCIFGSSKPKPPAEPKQYAAQKAPTRAQSKSAGERTADRIASKPKTLLAGKEGVGAVDESGKKKLFGE